MCVVCHEPLGVAQSPEAFQERDYIRQLIAQGKTRKEIENDLVQQYGPAVLSRPPAHGVNLLVYIVPPLVLILGIVDDRDLHPPLAAPAPVRGRSSHHRRRPPRWTPPTPSASTRTSGASPDGAWTRPPATSSPARSTPSSHSASLIVWRAACESAIRKDSVASGSAPTTLQSR